jgi:Raf kinase inhibitor-like YbhB/YbcL family protein
MRLWSNSFQDGGLIPERCAFGALDPDTHVHLAGNRSPHLAWDDVPAGTASLALFCIDVDAPAVGTDVNREGHVVREALARTEFYHWSLVDIPPGVTGLPEGQFSDLVTPRGKSGPEVPFSVRDGAGHRLRHGLNDYTGWFATDPDMAGNYFGYDGPCPPWNDERIHHYVFLLCALDIARLPLDGSFTGQQARAALRGHLLDEAQLIGVYSLEPRVAATLVP